MTPLGRDILDEGSLVFTATFFEAVNRQPFLISEHHAKICAKLDEILNGTHPTNRLILNIPPRHSKTELAVVAFCAMGFAINPSAEIMHLSASNDLVMRNVTNIRKIMDCPQYKLLYPDTKLTNIAKGSIYTSSNGVLYSAPFFGQVTGFGCGKLQAEEFAGAMLIDDPMKAQDQFSDIIKGKISQLWSGTFKSRLNDIRTPVIVTAQRLADDDFCGQLIDSEGTIEDGGVWDVVRYPAIIDYGTDHERALWEARNSLAYLKEYADKDPYDFNTQYMQNPTPLEGLMYSRLKTYDIIPYDLSNYKRNYTDTADTGGDYLCSICYVETQTGCYVTDVLYTKKSMEFTEEAVTNMLCDNNTAVALIESNNGGRGFARVVEKNLVRRGRSEIRIDTFTQTNNKNSRIFTASAAVQNIIYFPTDWDRIWPEFAKAVKTYRKEGGNTNDDAPDVLSGIIEQFRGDTLQINYTQLLDDFS